jgi:hypothetical protein
VLHRFFSFERRTSPANEIAAPVKIDNLGWQYHIRCSMDFPAGSSEMTTTGPDAWKTRA